MSAIDIQHAMLVAILETDPPLIGPFAVRLDRESTSPYRNYAAPRTTAVPTRSDIDDLVALFASRGLPARLEYVEHGSQLTDALLGAGFTVAQRIPVLRLATLVPPRPAAGVIVGAAVTRDDLVGAAGVMALAYGDDVPIEHAADRLQRTVDAGGSVTVGRHKATRQIVGAGLHTSPVAGLVELAAVATHPDFRRLGIASNVGADLVEHAAGIGAAPFLQAEGDDEARLYERLGFERCGSMVFADGPASEG
jgi:GNAT superfamily N-acetyltransferase